MTLLLHIGSVLFYSMKTADHVVSLSGGLKGPRGGLGPQALAGPEAATPPCLKIPAFSSNLTPVSVFLFKFKSIIYCRSHEAEQNDVLGPSYSKNIKCNKKKTYSLNLLFFMTLK